MNSYTFAELYQGQAASFSKTFSEEDLDTFIKLSGDHSPLHQNLEHAKELGFSNRVLHGLLTSALFSTLVGVYLPGKHALLLGVDVSFHHPVFPNEQLDVHGEIKTLHTVHQTIDIRAHIKNPQGKKVSKAKIQVKLNA